MHVHVHICVAVFALHTPSQRHSVSDQNHQVNVCHITDHKLGIWDKIGQIVITVLSWSHALKNLMPWGIINTLSINTHVR